VTTGGSEEEIGVSRKKESKNKSKPKNKKKDMSHLQAANMAMGAVPTIELDNLEDNHITKLYALGNVPKVLSGQLIVTMSEVMKVFMVR